MPTVDGRLADILGIIVVLILVLANGFFVAAEFSLVAVRRSRVAELVAAGRTNAKTLQRALDRRDANLAATQLGITISSLALGWAGEPALADLIARFFDDLPGALATAASHTIAVAIAFTIITVLHIVLGELAPKGIALQHTEVTALWVAGPLRIFRFILRPAIWILNGLGNQALRLFGLKPGSEEHAVHSADELKLLIAASHDAGLLRQSQQVVAERALGISSKRVTEIMTPRIEVEWVDVDDSTGDILRAIRECRHEQLPVCRRSSDEILGMILKRDLLDQVLDGGMLDPIAAIVEPMIIPETMTILTLLEQFKKRPVRMALIVDEYGGLKGIVTQTDLLEAITGTLSEADNEAPEAAERADGSLLIDGMIGAEEAFARLRVPAQAESDDYTTLAGFALFQFGRIPNVGDSFVWNGWRFEVVDMDGRRIDKLLVTPAPSVP